jgi:hypothetical protein
MTPEETAAAAAAATGTFDQAAFTTTLMAEVTKAIAAQAAASQKAMKLEMAKFALKPDQAAADAAAAAEAAAAADALALAGKDPKIAALERSIRELTERNRVQEEATKASNLKAQEKELKALETERQSAIRASLGDFQFASDDAREDAFRAFRDEVKRGDDGELYGGDFVPVKDFIKARMATKTHLLAPRDVTSSGAREHNGTQGGRQSQLEDIKPGMDAKTREAAWAAVAAAIK